MSNELSEKDLIDRFMDGLQMSAESMRLLGVMRGNSDMVGIGMILAEIRTNGHRLAMSKGMPRAQSLEMLERRGKLLSAH